MATTSRPWTVLPHRPIEKLSENVWSVDGDLPGMKITRRMTLIRLGDGRVVVHSAAALDAPAMAEIEAWGEPAVLVVPNGFHRLDVHAWKDRYPKAKVICPAPATKKVAEVVGVDGDYAALPADPALTVERVEGTHDRVPEGVFRMQLADGKVGLLFNDILFNHQDVPGVAGWVLRNITQSTGKPRVSRLMRVAGVASSAKVAGHLRRLADIPDLAWAIPGHGDVLATDVAPTLRAVADDLHGP